MGDRVLDVDGREFKLQEQLTCSGSTIARSDWGQTFTFDIPFSRMRLRKSRGHNTNSSGYMCRLSVVPSDSVERGGGCVTSKSWQTNRSGCDVPLLRGLASEESQERSQDKLNPSPEIPHAFDLVH